MAIKEVPFDDKGNMMRQVSRWHETNGRTVDWRQNISFFASLRIVSYSKWDSTLSLTWEDVEGRTYPMMFSDFMELVEKREISCGRTRREKWTVKKRGTVYGIALAEPDSADVY